MSYGIKYLLNLISPTSLLQPPAYFIEYFYSYKGGFTFFPRTFSYPFKPFIKYLIQPLIFCSSFNNNGFTLYYYSLVLSRGIIGINNYRNIPVDFQILIFPCSIICYESNSTFVIDIRNWYNMWYIVMRSSTLHTSFSNRNLRSF